MDGVDATKVNLIELPNEIQEKIIEYLILFKTKKSTNRSIPYYNTIAYMVDGYIPCYEVINYSMTNKKIMNICDNFFRRRLKLEKFPVELLCGSNVVREYIQLQEDIFCIRAFHILSDKCCFKRAILKDDINRVKLLGSLVLNSYKSTRKKIRIYLKNAEYAFSNNKNRIGKWFIEDFCERGLVTLATDGDSIDYLCGIIECLSNRNTDLVYYILDKFHHITPLIKRYALNSFAKIEDVDNLKRMINNYTLTIDDFDYAIVDIKRETTLRFLLRYYQGNGEDLNKMVNEYPVYVPTIENLSILCEHGFNDYSLIIERLATSYYPLPELIEIVKFLLLNYGDTISSNAINFLLRSVDDDKMIKVLSEYISSFDNK